jgi:hypothetical protein
MYGTSAGGAIVALQPSGAPLFSVPLPARVTGNLGCAIGGGALYVPSTASSSLFRLALAPAPPAASAAATYQLPAILGGAAAGVLLLALAAAVVASPALRASLRAARIRTVRVVRKRGGGGGGGGVSVQYARGAHGAAPLLGSATDW